MQKDMHDDREQNIIKPRIATLQELISNIEGKKTDSRVKSAISKTTECSDIATANNYDDEPCNGFVNQEDDVLCGAITTLYENHKDGAGGTKGKRLKIQKVEERFTTADQVYNYALSLLTFRDYSKAEMLSKLVKKCGTEAFSREAVAKLLKYNFLNEERYAFRVYEMWLAKRIYGRAHLQAELKKRSIETEAIAKVMEAFTSDLEANRAEAAAEVFLLQNRKKLQELKQLDDEDTEDFCEEYCNSPQDKGRRSFKTSKFSSRYAKRYAARQRLQAAAGRFMAARGFSGRYMHILLNKLHHNNDM